MFFYKKITDNKYDLQEDTPSCKYLYNMKCFEGCLEKLIKHFLKHQCLFIEKKCLVKYLPSITNALKYNYFYKNLISIFHWNSSCMVHVLSEMSLATGSKSDRWDRCRQTGSSVALLTNSSVVAVDRHWMVL
jgi:hypothetical protein